MLYYVGDAKCMQMYFCHYDVTIKQLIDSHGQNIMLHT